MKSRRRIYTPGLVSRPGSVFIMATIVFTALFTADVVNRALSSRSIGIIGAPTILGEHLLDAGSCSNVDTRA